MSTERARAQSEAFLASPFSKFRPWFAPNGVSPQLEFMRARATHRFRMFRAGNQGGKGGTEHEPLLTPTGWKTYGTIRVGDEVVSGAGTSSRVMGVFRRGAQPTFRLTFDDGSFTTCDEDHLWKVLTRRGRFHRRKADRCKDIYVGIWDVMSLREIRAKWGDNPLPIQRVAIPVVEPVQFAHRPVTVDPYLLGLLLGDGSIGFSGVSYASGDEQLVNEVAARLPAGCSIKKRDRYNYGVNGSAPLQQMLRAYGLLGKHSHDKFVPDDYLWNDVETRLAVLQGLMDTDGTVSSDQGRTTFCSTSKALVDAVVFIVRSLGGKAKYKTRTTHYTYKGEKKAGRLSYHVRVRLTKFCPFRLKKKVDRWFAATSREDYRVLHKIEPMGEAETICIAVDHPDKTYVTKDFIVTHNTTISVFDALASLLGLHPFCRFRPPIFGWLSALDWEFGIGQVLWPKMRVYLPMDQVENILWYRRAEPSLPMAIVFKNQSRLEFKSAESDRKKYQGATLHFVGVDEEHPSDIVEECKARLIKYGGDFWATLTPVRRERWVLDMERLAQCKVIRANSMDAAKSGILDLTAVEAFADSLSDRQRAVRISGDFAQLEGLVYPDWSRRVHILHAKKGQPWMMNEEGSVKFPWPIPPDWPRYSAIDFGYSNPTAILVAALDPIHNAIIVYRVYYATGVRGTEWAQIIRKELPILAAPMVADHDAFERAEFAEAGIPTVPAWKAKTPGLEAVERYLRPSYAGKGWPRFFVVQQDDDPPRHERVGRCDGQVLANEMDGYRYPSQREGAPDKRDEPIKAEDHSLDAARYLVYFLERHAFGIDPAKVVPKLWTPGFDEREEPPQTSVQRLAQFGPIRR